MLGAFFCLQMAKNQLALVRRQKQAARKILGQQQAVYSGLHEFRITSLDEFPELDRDFYQRMAIWFEFNGFRFVGDRQNVTLLKIFGHRTVLRTFLDESGTTVGVVYHLQINRRQGTRHHRAMDLESELSDGTFIATTNTLASGAAPTFEGIQSHRFATDTPPPQLLQSHRASVVEALAQRPDVSLTVCHDIDDVIQFQHRMQALKSRHKEAHGFAVGDVIRAVRQRELTANERAIVDEIERLEQRQRSG